MAGDAIIASLILGGMCLLMWALARMAKRRMGLGAGTVSASALRVVGKRPLDQKSAIWVVEVAGRHLLLGSGADGSVSKLDDISPEEYARMVEVEAEPAKPLLRVARSATTPAAAPAAAGSADSPVEERTEQAFATVGESFQHLLGKARGARDSRRGRRASGE